MRCQKIRSSLSAYCNDELVGYLQVKIREHLAGCPACRREEAIFRSVMQSTKEIGAYSVKSDFNARLLNRVAHERFAETRTKAYLPKPAPVVRWAHVVPAFVVASLLLIVAVNFYAPVPGVNRFTVSSSTPTTASFQDESYKYAQPRNNPNVTATMSKDWSLNDQMMQSERLSRMSYSLTNVTGFSNLHLASGYSHRASLQPLQYQGVIYYRVQPVVRVYELGRDTGAQEGEKVF